MGPAKAQQCADRVDCPVPHTGGKMCWLCGSRWVAWVPAWVYGQWARAGKPTTAPR